MGSSLKIVLGFLILFFNSLVFAGGDIAKDKDKNEIVMDIIHVHGMVLKGKITNLGPNNLSFRLVNIDGINHIPYKDIDSIHTKYRYNIFYGNEKVSGRVVGIVDEKSLKVNSKGQIKMVNIADIDHFSMSIEDDDSTENYVRNIVPFTSGNFHIGLELESGANIKNKTNLNANFTRKKGQNEAYFHFDYAYETTETSTTEKAVNKDELSLTLGNRYSYDYDNSDHFLFGGLLSEYDRPRNIDYRFVPNAGYGHNLQLGKNGWLKPMIGLAYVWTKYTDEDLYPRSNYTAGAFGLTGQYTFNDVKVIKTLKVDGRYIYYPSLEDPSEEWLSRANLGFTVPLYEFLTMRLNIEWINDSNPDPSIGNNKTQANLMFGVDF
jgi:hypothetical protein